MKSKKLSEKIIKTFKSNGFILCEPDVLLDSEYIIQRSGEKFKSSMFTFENEDGKIVSSKDTDPWGRRKFTYRINHKWEGFYVVLEIATQATNIDSTDRLLRLADRSEIVRHKIIRLPDEEAVRRGLLENTTA